MNDDYAPQIEGQLKLAAACARRFMVEKHINLNLFEDFYAVAQFAIAPYLSDDCSELKDKGSTYVWKEMENAMTDHMQSLRLVNIPSTTRARWVAEGKEFIDPIVESIERPDPMDEDGGPTPAVLNDLPEVSIELLDALKNFDAEMVEARLNEGGDPANPLDVAEKLGLTLPQVAARLLRLERSVCELLNRQVPTSNRKACPPESTVAQEEGAARVA